MAWRNYLKNHKIFSDLPANKINQTNQIESKNLTTIKDGELYVWNSDKACVFTTNLKNLGRKNEETESRYSYQTLLCTSPPVFDVFSLQFNETGSLLALVGRAGVAVMEMPQRWGRHGEFEGGKERITCRVTYLAERYFVSCGGSAGAAGGRDQLLQAAWHPGSDSDTHITLLTADNTLRVYSLFEPQQATHVYPLSPGDPHTTYFSESSRHLGFDIALGEFGVSFDFGLPVELTPKKHSEKKESSPLAWPIYVLMGNGDVYMLMSVINRPYRSALRGPLHMFPPAEDNYGTDACSLLCLASRPTTLAVATCEGKLYHCVALPRAEEEDDAESTFSESSCVAETTVFARVPEPSLYVYEQIELELELTTRDVDTDTTVGGDFTCPIHLHKDPSCADRYHCSHAAGVHTVALPWLDGLDAFCATPDSDGELKMLDDSQHAIVEHVICTKPMPTSPAAPVQGLCLAADRLLGPGAPTLVCLTASNLCLLLPLLQSYKPPPPALLSTSPSRSSLRSPLRALSHREPFDQHIRKILARSASNPLIKTPSEVDLSPQECFQLLTRTTQVFREEYLQKHDHARQQIAKRVSLLEEQKQQQHSDLLLCLEQKNKLTDAAHVLADKYEDAADSHKALMHRVELVLKRLQQQMPTLSDAEHKMQRELRDLQEKLSTLSAAVQQLGIKRDYQRRQISQHATRSTDSPRGVSPRGGGAGFSKVHGERLKAALKSEGDEISDLVKQINSLKVALDV